MLAWSTWNGMSNLIANHQPIHGGSSQRFIPYPGLDDPEFYEKIYRKKEFYDTKPAPLPSPDDQTLETLDRIFRLAGDFRLLAQQRFLRNYVSEATPYGGILIFHGTGVGKCHRFGTKILLKTGEIREVQDLEVGDELMNDQSEGNMITSLARGHDDMYEIIPVKGKSYVVNSEHILCLKRTNIGITSVKAQTGKPWKTEYLDMKTVKIRTKSFATKEEAESYLEKVLKETDDVLEIAVKDYLQLSKHKKHLLKGYRVGVDFPKQEIGFDPYIIGIWLGDGSKRDPVISMQDSVVIKYIVDTLPKYELTLNFQSGYDYRISSFKRNNILIDELRRCDLLNNKHIPLCYKANSRYVRLQVLAGLLDSDGSVTNLCYEITQKRKQLANDILYLARSLGFAAYCKECQKSCTYKGEKKTGTYYRIQISGDGLDQIPVKIERKKVGSRKQKKDVLVTGIKVKHLGVGNYYGFTLTGNGRYLLEDFTVTHNTCAAISVAERFRNRIEETGKRILVVVGRNIKDEFQSTIFNFDKEAARLGPRQIVQCTGRTYQLGAEARHLSDKQRRKAIERAIRNNYDFAGHLQLVNQAKHIAHWNGHQETITPAVRQALSDHYSDRVIIVDEVHHGVGTEGEEEKFPFVLQTIVESADNIRLILMTATPMVNSPKDILLPINLLRVNDGREPAKAKDIFNQDGAFVPGGEKKLMEAVKGYISYVRGDDPPRFPYKLQAPEAKTPHPIYQISGEKIPKKANENN